MQISRRDMLKASAAIVTARGLLANPGEGLRHALAASAKPPVIWLQGQGCNGDSVSLLNSIYYMAADQLLLNTIDLRFHPTVMAAAGDLAVSAAQQAQAAGGHILVVEGAIATGSSGKYCFVWPGMTILGAVQAFSVGAGFILAVGTCATHGGMTGGAPNPTAARGVGDVLLNDARVINIPGCPAHPDWVVGTVAYLLAQGRLPALDSDRRPTMFFGRRIHDWCPQRARYCGEDREAAHLGEKGCLKDLGCRGPQTFSDCFLRAHNSPGPERFGVNWCVQAGAPCIGCTEPDFPDGMSPFFERGG